MNVSFLQENAKKALAIVGHAVAGKSTLPVLQNAYLEAKDGKLMLAATNLEIGIRCWIGAKVEEAGATTIPFKLLNDVIGGLPNDKVTLDLDARTETTNLTCARVKANLKGIEADEFPVIPTVEDGDIVSFNAAELAAAIQQVAFAAATDDTRPVLTGVLFRIGVGKLTMVAADGFRLAVKTLQTATEIKQDVLIPARALMELARILATVEGDVSMCVTPNQGQVLFRAENVELVSRLIEGKFPDFERIIPPQYTTRTVFDTKELAQAVKLASYFANASANIVKFDFAPTEELEPGKVTISANAAEVGDNTTTLDAMIGGNAGQIALNVKFLAEAINAMKVPQIALETQTSQSPGVFKPVGDDSYISILMPMTVK